MLNRSNRVRRDGFSIVPSFFLCRVAPFYVFLSLPFRGQLPLIASEGARPPFSMFQAGAPGRNLEHPMQPPPHRPRRLDNRNRRSPIFTGTPSRKQHLCGKVVKKRGMRQGIPLPWKPWGPAPRAYRRENVQVRRVRQVLRQGCPRGEPTSDRCSCRKTFRMWMLRKAVYASSLLGGTPSAVRHQPAIRMRALRSENYNGLRLSASYEDPHAVFRADPARCMSELFALICGAEMKE